MIYFLFRKYEISERQNVDTILSEFVRRILYIGFRLNVLNPIFFSIWNSFPRFGILSIYGGLYDVRHSAGHLVFAFV